jgi:two-component system response regulator AtoC
MHTEILIVEDEEYLRDNLLEFTVSEGYKATAVDSLANARAALARSGFDLVILDLKLPDGSGLELLADMDPNEGPLAVVVTAFPEVQTAIRALKLGAYDYLNKPFDLDELSLVLRRALETRSLRREVRSFRSREKKRLHQSMTRMVGQSAGMVQVREAVSRVAAAEKTTALILGESGVGKELVAEAIHYHSSRGGGPLLKINCAAIPPTLLESELFGYEKGAFTGATSTQQGLFELAANGTLFLDEIAEMEIGLQAKMLRVLEDRQLMRVGGRRPIPVNARIVTATNRNLEMRVRDGQFREDLYYRLNVFPIEVPPLRQRREDIVPLALKFLADFTTGGQAGPATISEACRGRLLDYPWPGNVRELRNLVERAVLMHAGDGGELEIGLPQREGPVSAEGGAAAPTSLAEVAKSHILAVYHRTGRNKTQTADLLGINRLTLRRKLKEFGVE